VTDRYSVIGNPVAHSRSPDIHAAFALATGQDIEYLKLLAPLEGFAAAVASFRESGGRGASITVPFKEEAFRLAGALSDRARRAGAVNTLLIDPERILGDNTDGAGLVCDLLQNLGIAIAGKRILLVGAGGAARGVLGPLLDEKPATVDIANRSAARAAELAAHFAGVAADRLALASFAALSGRRFDIVINATAASLAGVALDLPEGIYAEGALAYDLMYGSGDTPFMAQARAQGARVADGLGMLVEQAAEAFLLWRGVRPATAPVLQALRRAL
jgi:shikimate dehydrogenase